MKISFRGSQETIAKALTIANSGMYIEVDNVTLLLVDGKPFPTGAVTPSPAPAPAALTRIYFTGEGLAAAVLAAKPPYQVFCDSDGGAGDPPKLPGSGNLLPAMRFGSQDPKTHPNAMVLAMNLDHPYWVADIAPGAAPVTREHVEAAAEAVPLLQKAAAEPAGVDPTKLWESVPATLDPLSMAFLIHWMGGTVNGMNATQQVAAYRKWYYTFHGRQAAGGPTNREVITDAEIAALIAS